MNIFKLIKLANNFFALANDIISPEQLENLFNSSTIDLELLKNLDDLRRFFHKKIAALTPKSHTDVDKSLGSLKIIEDLYKTYIKVIDNFDNDYLFKHFAGDKYLSEMFRSIIELKNIQRYFNSLKGKCRDLLYSHYYGNKVYIRFGKYPKGERSRMGLGEEWVQELGGKTEESGVSVYRTMSVNNKWLLIDADASKAVYQYHGFDPELFADAINAGDIYLVTGRELKETGADGDTLLKDIAPIKKLSPDDIILNESSEDTLLDLLKKYKYKEEFKGFNSPEEDRELALGIHLLSELVESSSDDNEETDWLADVLWGRGKLSIDKLSSKDKERMLSIIRRIRKQKNKERVMEGYRPLY